MSLPALGIDPRIADLLQAQGIDDLYEPQKQAWAALKDGRNCLVAIPTASGKSLIAYLAMLHRWLATGKKALYIVPLRALASEKFDELRALRGLGFSVGIATGDLDDRDQRLGRHDIIVLTSEKADSLLRHRTPWVDDIGCVVADEVHLVHDPGRGPTLEVLLSRFRALLPTAQIIGLSATIQNAQELATWLDAELVTSDWRPVELHVGTYMGDNLDMLGQGARELPAGGDPVASLVEDAIQQGGQCLVFVSTRRSAEAQAQRLAGTVRSLLDAEDLAALEHAVLELDAREEAGPTQAKLRKLCLAGSAYHTAGLDAKQRRFVEENFRAGRLKVLCATPTLAAGVNTPARRVIIRDIRRFEAGRGNVPLPVMEVHQMMGRAGRPRFDPYGEAVLIAKDPDMKDILVEEYLRGRPEPVTSKLAADAALRIHTLASIAGGYCDSEESLLRFFQHTFWGQQTEEWILRDRIDDTIWFLEDHGFMERDGARLAATLFGRRTSDLYIDPFSALRMRQALEASHGPTDFAILHAIGGCPDLYPLYLRQSDGWVQELYFQRHAELLIPDEDMEDAASHTKTASLLADWLDEATQQQIEERYQIGPGDVRLRVDTAGWLLHGMRELARALEISWHNQISELAMRLQHGIRKELLPLVRLRGIGRVRARTLAKHGFGSLAKIKGTPVATLAALPGFGDKVARDLLRQVGDKPEKRTQDRDDGPKDAPEEALAAPSESGQVGLAAWGSEP